MLDLKVLTQVLGELEEDQVMELLKEFAATNPSEIEALAAVEACQAGMAIVGDLLKRRLFCRRSDFCWRASDRID